MTAESDAFEQLNARIRKLVDGRTAKVTWNAHIPDPDSPKVLRQIDVLIEEGGRRTAVECRDRDSSQSVTWVEELVGRRISLGLDGIIGVAVNGFSKPAVVKAKRHGVALYDFRSLTDAEISSWGGAATVESMFIQFDPLLITAAIESVHRQGVGLAPLFRCNGKDGYSTVMQLIRDNAAANPGSHRVELLNPTGFEVDCIPIVILTVGYVARLVPLSASCTAVQAVDHPGTPALMRSVTVQRFDHTVSEVILHRDAAHALVNVSTLAAPTDSLLHEMKITFPQSMSQADYELIGDNKIWTRCRRTALHVVAVP
jgi:hypothetical protein